MNWKVFYSLISLLFAVTYISAQTDSLLVASDSLKLNQAIKDSLAIQAFLDSLNIQEEVNVDYSAYLELNQKVEQYKTESRAKFIGDSNKRLFWSIQGHLFGLSSENYHIKRNSFSELPSLYPTFLKLQNYNRFYTENISGDFYSLTKEYYQLPVTAIEVVAGTGDYELGTGFVALKKNKFLNRYNLDFRMNFLKGYLNYGSELSSNSNTTLIIPLEKSNINISLNSISYEGPYHRLSPTFRLNTSIFEETSQAVSIFYDNSFLDLGLKYSKESYKRITPSTLNREYVQLLLAKAVSLEQWQGNISYEYLLHDEDFYNQELNSLSSDIDHLLDIEIASDFDKFNLNNRLVLTYPTQLLNNTSVSYNLTNTWELGAFTNNRKTSKKDNLFTSYHNSSDPDSDEFFIQSPFYLNEKNYTGVSLKYLYNNLNLAVEVGNTCIESELFTTSFKGDYQALKTQFSGNYTYSYSKYKLNLASLMSFYHEYDGYDIHYTPKANFSNSLEIIADINHNNYIKAGVSHQYIDAYLAFNNKIEILYPEASLLDLYLGFQITKQFEINGYWKNILNSQVTTGEQSIPQSITVLISWNFLN